MSDYLWPHGLWDLPGKNTGAGCHFLLQGIIQTQWSNQHLLYWQADSSSLSQPPGKTLPPNMLNSKREEWNLGNDQSSQRVSYHIFFSTRKRKGYIISKQQLPYIGILVTIQFWYIHISWKWKSHSCVWLFVTLWTINSMEFSRPEYWSG